MKLLAPLRRWIAAARVPIWHDPAYRLPLAGVEGRMGIEPRRADHVLWALRAARIGDVRAPSRVSYRDLGRVHDAAYLESLHDPATLARIFAAEASEIVVDEVMRTLRLACGATLAAARAALLRSGPTLNLLGGFHHAGPRSGGGLCALNDIAVAIAALRAEGFGGRACVVDLDAHPPDGTAECLARDPAAWIGSLSGARWVELAGVDETVLAAGCGDEAYLAALAALLRRMPAPALAFVIAGGDVLAGDRLGKLGLSLEGARRRDVAVRDALRGVASVWLPGGGYHDDDAWRVLAGTALVLADRSTARLPAGDPLRARFGEIAGGLAAVELRGDEPLTMEDIIAELDGHPPLGRLLGYYGVAGIEHALDRYGLLEQLERLGYSDLRVAVDRGSIGDRARLFGAAGGREHLLVELIVEPQAIAGRQLLFIHWLTLRHPRAAAGVPLLPGQEVPGLGLARETCELVARMAARLGLAGVAFRPSHYHLAYVGRTRFRFLDPARQGRFEALVRDLGHLPLPQATLAVASGRVLLNGAPYTWEADEMLDLSAPPDDAAAVAAAREAARFTVAQPLREGAPATQ